MAPVSFALLSIVLLLKVSSSVQQCSVDIPESERRDCYPWENANQGVCEARGCAWCTTSTEGVPHCYYNDKVCPSEVPESSRVDCMPEGGGRSDCLRKGCDWCETTTPDIPWCFDDPSTSLGGEFCPTDVPVAERVDCHPDQDASADSCVRRGCYWCDQSVPDSTPWCITPRQVGYRAAGPVTDTAKGYSVQLERIDTPSWFGQDFDNVLLEVEFHTEDRLRFKFTPVGQTRWEVPITVESPATKPSSTQYDVTFNTSGVFSFRVTRKQTGAVIFDTSIGGLILSDQFLQISTRLNSANLYGFGEHEHQSIRHDMNWRTWAMYARDQAVTDSNLYGVQPIYMNVEQSGNAHGVLFLNSNAQEVQLMPAPALTYRTIGGILDIYMFLGPSPDNVVEQLTEAVGRPVMVPYWALGFQLCRYGYQNVDHMKEAVDRMRQYNIPHDIQYADIDYMDGWRDFTLDSVNFGELPEYVQELKQEGTRFIIILDPAIKRDDPPGSYPALDRGNQYDVWVENADGSPANGTVWPGPVYFPDYTKPATETWWTEECVLFKDVIDYDGLWIDMNEPANFVDGSPSGCSYTNINYPPYVPAVADRSVYVKTMCPDRVHDLGLHYNVHSIYGWSMAKQTLPAVRTATGKRSVVFSRSTFPGASQYAQHWLGDNFSQWPKLHFSLIGVMEFNMFGIPYVGPDICGFIGDTTEELCLRWQQIGSFYTFSRNHNAIDAADQDPGLWPSVGTSTRDTLLIRYTLLPFLYTLMHQSHVDGTPVIRPMFFDFPTDANTYTIDKQIQWGSALLISPVLEQGVTSVSAYFPDARHFSYYDGAEVGVRTASTDLSAPLDFIPLHIRGGYILPTQQPDNSTMWSRSHPMGLIVALDDTQHATGSLFWDDGESVDTYTNGNYYMATYSVQAAQLTNTIEHQGYDMSSLVMDDIRIMGLDLANVVSVTINGQPFASWTYNTSTKQLTLSNAAISMTSAFTVAWSESKH